MYFEDNAYLADVGKRMATRVYELGDTYDGEPADLDTVYELLEDAETVSAATINAFGRHTRIPLELWDPDFAYTPTFKKYRIDQTTFTGREAARDLEHFESLFAIRDPEINVTEHDDRPVYTARLTVTNQHIPNIPIRIEETVEYCIPEY